MGIFGSLVGGLLGSGIFGGGKGKTALSVLGGALGSRSSGPGNNIGRVVRQARAAGIHPLAALGSPAAGNYASPVGQHSSGDVIHDGGNRLARELMQQQIDTEKAKQVSLLSEAQSRTQAAQMRAASIGGREPIPLWVPYVDRQGNIHYGPNPDIADIEQLPMPAAIQTLTGPIVGRERRPPARPGPPPMTRHTGPTGRPIP